MASKPVAPLQDVLVNGFSPAHSVDFDASVAIRYDDRVLHFVIQEAAIEFVTSLRAPELTLYFTSQRVAEAVLTGRTNPIDAFMRGDFRSSGYIMKTFQLISIFAGASLKVAAE